MSKKTRERKRREQCTAGGRNEKLAEGWETENWDELVVKRKLRRKRVEKENEHYHIIPSVSLFESLKIKDKFFLPILVKILSISSMIIFNLLYKYFYSLFFSFFFFTSEESSHFSRSKGDAVYREKNSRTTRCKGASISARWQGARRDGARERHEEEIREPAKRKQRDVTRWGEKGGEREERWQQL